jgi:putative oligomerization/nucleic acid binding protein
MPLMRRRPLMRAAMVGGAGYMAGKRRAAGQQQEATQNEQIADLQATQGQQPTAAPQQPPSAPATGAPVASETERIEALTKLKTLLDSGVLTQEQFDAERQKLLQGM